MHESGRTVPYVLRYRRRKVTYTAFYVGEEGGVGGDIGSLLLRPPGPVDRCTVTCKNVLAFENENDIYDGVER